MVRNAWMARVMAACLIPGILLLFTLEVEAAASSAGEIQERIERLADGKSYEGAAFLSERLLGDYSRAKGYLLKQWDQVQNAVDPSHRWRVSVELAHCAARLGEFDEADAWLARAKAAGPDRGRDEIEKEIALCREWAPRRDGARKGFEASPSIEAARNLLDAYAHLEEYAGMQWVMREALSRFPNEPWLESDEFQRTKRFVDAYLTPIPPTSGRQEVPTVPAKDLEIESLFGRLHENRDKRDDLCWGKWKALSLAEKARALKPLVASQPAPGEGDWQPSEAEAEMFLRRLGLVGDEAESFQPDPIQKSTRIPFATGSSGMRNTSLPRIRQRSLAMNVITSRTSGE